MAACFQEADLQRRVMIRSLAAAMFLFALTAPAQPVPARASLEELRHGLTIGGKPIPPEVFGDFGDSDMADSGSIRVTIDVAAAIGSNLYADDIKVGPNGWVTQTKVGPGPEKLTETTAYKFEGVTRNGLLVVTAAYSGGGSGDFFTLHILDATTSRAFDGDGKLYDRINLTVIRSIPLGDRWDGVVKIAGDTIAIVTERREPNTSNRPPGTQRIEAVRP
jgi:hypothetical protein